MSTVARPTSSDFSARPILAKKKASTEQAASAFSHQMNIRVPRDLYSRIEETAATLGLDSANFLRMVIKENLAQYERRADQIRLAGERD